MAPSDTSIQGELFDCSQAILDLLFLSEGNCTAAQLEDYSDQLTHLLRYARCLGFHAAFIWKDGAIAVEWQSLGVAL